MTTSPWPDIQQRSLPEVDWPGTSPLMARLLAARGVEQTSLDFSLKQLPRPEGLVPAEAVQLLLDAYRQQQRIVVVADYDTDGATACAVMVRGLRLLGFEQVDFLVPDRFVHGYGLTPSIVEEARQLQPDLLVTVDNGVASVAGVEAAKAAGINVLITDHHLPGKQLPDAVMVNPRLQPDFAASELAGVGVAFYVLMALRQALRQVDEPNANANLAQLLDLVALGTVADVVTLDHYNRILVEQGLRRMRAGAACAGVSALVKVSGREQTRLTSADMGFALGPRLNAAGRLADMRHGIDCLLADDATQAQQLAEELDAINRDRRAIETDMVTEARHQVAQLRKQGTLPLILCLYSPHWHEGIVGLLASRVKELTQRPVVAFANAQQEGEMKGSARSVTGLHIRDVLADVAAQSPGLLSRFGGHAMAAGLSLSKDKLAAFRDALQQAVNRRITSADLQNRVLVDGELADDQLTLEQAEQLTLGMPWGKDFPAPLFHGTFEVLSQRIVGERHVKLTLGLPATNGVIDAIHFNTDPAIWQGKNIRRVEGVYRLESNYFRGRVAPQLLFDHLRPCE